MNIVVKRIVEKEQEHEFNIEFETDYENRICSLIKQLYTTDYDDILYKVFKAYGKQIISNMKHDDNIDLKLGDIDNYKISLVREDICGRLYLEYEDYKIYINLGNGFKGNLDKLLMWGKNYYGFGIENKRGEGFGINTGDDSAHFRDIRDASNYNSIIEAIQDINLELQWHLITEVFNSNRSIIYSKSNARFIEYNLDNGLKINDYIITSSKYSVDYLINQALILGLEEEKPIILKNIDMELYPCQIEKIENLIELSTFGY